MVGRALAAHAFLNFLQMRNTNSRKAGASLRSFRLPFGVQRVGGKRSPYALHRFHKIKQQLNG